MSSVRFPGRVCVTEWGDCCFVVVGLEFEIVIILMNFRTELDQTLVTIIGHSNST